MKKFLYSLIGIIAVSTGLLTYAQAACDQTFYGTLRQGKQYTFNDTWNNNGSSSAYLRSYNVGYSEQYDYNRSSSFPSFGRTSAIKSANYEVKKGSSMEILTASSAYPVYEVPASRSSNNLTVTYTVTYSTDKAGTNKKSHTECKYYEISRCGDGVIDSNYGETCDDGSNNGKS
jgi:hypothetical protein